MRTSKMLARAGDLHSTALMLQVKKSLKLKIQTMCQFRRLSIISSTIIGILFLGCSDNNKKIKCLNLEKDLSLPMFIVLDKHSVEEKKIELETIFKKIDNNIIDKTFSQDLKLDLENSFKNAIKDSLLSLLFEKTNSSYGDILNLSYKNAKQLINKYADNEMSNADKQQLKFLLFKKNYIYETFYNSWFFDTLFFEYNTNIISDNGREIISKYYDYGTFVSFKNPVVNNFISKQYLEESLIVINEEKNKSMVVEKNKYSGSCMELYDFYNSLYSKHADYVIAIYHL